MSDESSEADDRSNPPLAKWCSLCDDGYHRNLKIEISKEPNDSPSSGKDEVRWLQSSVPTITA